jgi:hypothetical protein
VMKRIEMSIIMSPSHRHSIDQLAVLARSRLRGAVVSFEGSRSVWCDDDVLVS